MIILHNIVQTFPSPWSWSKKNNIFSLLTYLSNVIIKLMTFLYISIYKSDNCIYFFLYKILQIKPYFYVYQIENIHYISFLMSAIRKRKERNFIFLYQSIDL